MSEERAASGAEQDPSDAVVRELMAELGRSFDLATPAGGEPLGTAVERRIRSLKPTESPDWGTDGEMTQLARKQSGALDFYYRPHLFPEMDPALRLGHQLQFDLLPRWLPVSSPLRFAAVLESYCHLSGDLLGWQLEADELFFWIADVSGHGVLAGLAAATLYFLINNMEAGLPPALFAERINERMLAARNPADRKALFATAIWLRARADGSIRYASCGHNPMLLLRASGEVEALPSTGIPIGLLPGRRYREARCRLGAGDALCLFTDGLVEAKNPGGEEFGIERVADLRRGWSGSPIELTRKIYRALRAHQDGRLFDDDLTFLVAERATD